MTEPDPIPEGLRARLARELDAVPLATPHPAGARYQGLSAHNRGWRRLATAGALAAVAAVVLGAGTTAAAGPPQVLQWLQADVERLPFVAPAATPSPEPSEPGPKGPAVTAPRATEGPGPERAEPAEKPQDGESKTAAPTAPAERDHDNVAQPTPQPTATGEREGGQASPAPSASPEGGGEARD